MRCAEGSAGGPLVSAVLGGAAPAQLIAAFSFFPAFRILRRSSWSLLWATSGAGALVGLFLKWRKRRTRPIIFLGAGAVGSFLFVAPFGGETASYVAGLFQEHVSMVNADRPDHCLLACLAEPCFLALPSSCTHASVSLFFCRACLLACLLACLPSSASMCLALPPSPKPPLRAE